jgi:hypothetical protein
MATFERLTEPHFTYSSTVKKSITLPNHAEFSISGHMDSVRISITDGRNNFTAPALKNLVAELLYLIGDMEEARGARVEEQQMAPPFLDGEAVRAAFRHRDDQVVDAAPAYVVMDDIPDDDPAYEVRVDVPDDQDFQ